MTRIRQKIILTVCFLFFLALHSRAQKNRFVYIQSENRQMFYVKLADKLFNSSETGYVIIPALAEGTYPALIGFTKNETSQQRVSIVMKDADMGCLLKNFGDKGWGLVNLQTMQTVMARNDEGNQEPLIELATDSFSIILAAVVNDPGILKHPVVPKDSAILLTKEENKQVAGKEEKPAPEAQLKENVRVPVTQVKKISEENTADETRIIYLDVSDSKSDTIPVFIPVKATEDTLPKRKNEEVKAEVKNADMPVKDSRFLDMELPNPNLNKDTGAVISDTLVADKKADAANTRCKQTATEKDFLNLRKQMAAGVTDVNMINAALKKFRTTCFTTDQVKNLGALFLTDDGKYKLYVAAYPFVADLPQYGLLESQLKDEYYISRFRAMLHQ